LDLKSEKPAGHITVADNTYMVMLEAIRSEYDCGVSNDAGVKWSSGNAGFTWDVKSAEWKNAIWDSTLTFAFDVKEIDLGGIKASYTENYFMDLGESLYGQS
jgi:hypothetical protein